MAIRIKFLYSNLINRSYLSVLSHFDIDPVNGVRSPGVYDNFKTIHNKVRHEEVYLVFISGGVEF